jgi:putative YphP/YqiW family bacilliredoxin
LDHAAVRKVHNVHDSLYYTNQPTIMPYPEAMVKPMRAELTRLGVTECTDAEAVDAAFDAASDGTMLLVINSVCGCAAGNARPAIAMATQLDVQPDEYVTVFAGQDLEATERAREHLAGIPPSSPFIALFKEGQPVYVIERKHIEGRSANAIAGDLKTAFEAYCTADDVPADAPSAPDVSASGASGVPSSFQSIS